MDSISWQGYLKSNQSPEECRKRCASTFQGQRSRIRNLFHQLAPKTVVCMGAGYLNDIPIQDFVREGCRIFLVDWIRDLSRQAYYQDVVQKNGEGYRCLVCQVRGDPKSFCANYHFNQEPDPENPPGHCDSFQPSMGDNPQCTQFELGDSPAFLEEDVTQGVAGGFAEDLAKTIPQAKTPKMVFKKAQQVVRSLNRVKRILPVQDHSIDMVTSSMVVSQFDFEPYGFLEKNLALRFGVEALLKQEKVLLPLMNELRDKLLRLMVDRHFREIHRILRPDGRAYFSSETFRRLSGSDRWTPVQGASQTLEILEKYFWFEFNDASELPPTERLKLYGEESIVDSHVLIPKAPEELASASAGAPLP